MNSLIICSVLINLVFLYHVAAADDTWWGPRDPGSYDTSIRPFKVNFDKATIDDLRYRLRNHRPFTRPLEGVGFEYGFNTGALQSWVDYWANGYDFGKREAFFNQFPQYKTNIQGLDIHFLCVEPQVQPNTEVVTLLFLHGFPGTVRELYDAIPYLTQVDPNRNFAIRVVAPSLPGFGFSDAAVRPGLGADQIATVLKNLMNRLGIQKFYVQGGDWGSRIGSHMATIYPNEVLGYHTNMALSQNPLTLAGWVVGSIAPDLVVDPALADRMYPITQKLLELNSEFGYLHLQATKPDSLGVAIQDSPAGMLAYILQLMSSGTRRMNVKTLDGGLDPYFSRDSLLDILTLFWVTNSFTTSCRLYAESVNLQSFSSPLAGAPTPVPTWTIHAKDEIVYQSPRLLKHKYTNLLNSTVLQDGGHFLALEKPVVFSNDVINAVGAFNSYHKRYLF